MNLLFRLIWITLFSRFRSRCEILGPCRTPFRVAPTDLDVLRHMNNGKYLSIMDLARVDLMVRSGLLRILEKNGFYPVVVAETIKFKKSLKLFTRFEIETRVLGWDEKAFLLEQKFLQKDETIAVAFVRARFLRKTGGNAAPSEILKFGGMTAPSPALSEKVRRWNEDQLTFP